MPSRRGLEASRWRRVLDDAEWLLDGFAEPAFRNRWTPRELFGLWHYDGGLIHHVGGIADRLDGSRSLVVTADRASWRCFLTDQPLQFLRGAYLNLMPVWVRSR